MTNSLPSTLHTRYGEEVQLLQSGFTRFWCAVGILFALTLPWVLSSYWTGVANQALIAVVGALALNLLMGTRGRSHWGMRAFWQRGRLFRQRLSVTSTHQLVSR
jgi:hypothetical protein